MSRAASGLAQTLYWWGAHSSLGATKREMSTQMASLWGLALSSWGSRRAALMDDGGVKCDLSPPAQSPLLAAAACCCCLLLLLLLPAVSGVVQDHTQQEAGKTEHCNNVPNCISKIFIKKGDTSLRREASNNDKPGHTTTAKPCCSLPATAAQLRCRTRTITLSPAAQLLQSERQLKAQSHDAATHDELCLWVGSSRGGGRGGAEDAAQTPEIRTLHARYQLLRSYLTSR
jgi:hypothetical protein